EGKPALRPNWCEVTYINHVPAMTDGGRLARHAVLSMVRPIESPTFLPDAEDAQFAARFRIEEAGSPIGRLTVSAAPALTSDGAEVWVLNLTARSRAASNEVAAAFERLD